MSLALKVSGLSAGYGRKTVIEDVALDFAPGRIHLILGHNGAGKTTLARALFGLVTPGKGSILLNGREIAGTRPDRNVAAGIAYIPQRHGVFRGLSVSDNLKLGGYTEPQDHLLRERRDKVLALFPQLSQRLGQRAGSMSGGQQQ
ncbi:MAG: ATP-binding cassette domain-containing protein, partial [Desulfobacterales bacterium]|nr:ATP-binding cassette domain-containing protein [Desulfobacterales bacterium]